MEIIDAGPVRICVSATRLSGRDYVDIRTFVTDKSGILRPTQTGISIPVECYQEVIAAGTREHGKALQQERPVLYYFKEHVEDKREVRTSHSSRVHTLAINAVNKTPEEYGADESRGFIFKTRKYELVGSTYHFQPTPPFAVWDIKRSKWVRWEKRKKD